MAGPVPFTLSAMLAPVTPERRESVRIIVAVRWLLVLATLFVVNVRPGTTTGEQAILFGLIVAGALVNLVLQAGISRKRAFPVGLPVLAAMADAAAITAAVGTVDGFENPGFVLYYPALVSFSLAFSGAASIYYTAAVIVAYLGATTFRSGFDWASAGDQHELVLRLATMAASVLAANMVVRIERGRRLRAVAAEAARQAEVLALEQRTRDLERRAEDERARLVREIHDGLSQGAFMLSLGLETTAAELARHDLPPATVARVDALVRVSKQTLLETRNLLYDLRDVMAGGATLSGLLENQLSEFKSITGIETKLSLEGEERPLPPAVVSEVYRVVQEGLSNCYRHAQATAIEAVLRFTDNHLDLSLADNGRGFEGGRPGGHGLQTMGERVALLHGEFSVDSVPGGGTKLRARIPYNAANDTDSRPPG